MKIYCCGCDEDVNARLTHGSEIYPHRYDLCALPFWKCDACLNFVGCHHKTKDRTRPLGCIPTPEIKVARQKIHLLLDQLWKSGKMNRSLIYSEISKRVGWTYHTAEIKSLEEAQKVYAIVEELNP